MTDDLATTNGAVATVEPQVNLYELQRASEFADMNAAGIAGNRQSFLPRLQLFTGASTEVKQGKIGIAVYGKVQGEDIVELGKQVIVAPCAWRPKAMNFKSDPPQAYFRPATPEFQDFKLRSAQTNSGYGYGPEYLVWLGPEHGFLTFFMCNPTMRNSAQDIQALLPPPGVSQLRFAALSAVLIDDDVNQWHGPKILPSSQQLDRPDQALLEQVTRTFLTPKDFDPTTVKPKKGAPVAAGATDNVVR